MEITPTPLGSIIQQNDNEPAENDPFVRLKREHEEGQRAEAALDATQRQGITPDIAGRALDAELSLIHI